MFGDPIVPLNQVIHVWISNCSIKPGKSCLDIQYNWISKHELHSVMEQLDIQT
jgi:hypothetical protein